MTRIAVYAMTILAFIVVAWLLIALAFGWSAAMPDAGRWCFNPTVECMR